MEANPCSSHKLDELKDLILPNKGIAVGPRNGESQRGNGKQVGFVAFLGDYGAQRRIVKYRSGTKADRPSCLLVEYMNA